MLQRLLPAICIWFVSVRTDRFRLFELSAETQANPAPSAIGEPGAVGNCTNVADLVKVGGDVQAGYGAWWLCRQDLTAKPRVLSLGIGEDATFERAMIRDFGAEVWGFDPTPKAARYVAKFTGTPGASNWAHRFHFEKVGVGKENEIAKLTLPENPRYVSGRVGGAGCNKCEQIAVQVESLQNLLQRAGGRVDVLKMDVETMEFTVLDQILQENTCMQIPFEQLLVEYHDMAKHAQKMEAHKIYFTRCGFRRLKFGPESGTYAYLRSPRVFPNKPSLPSTAHACEQFEDLEKVGGDLKTEYGAWWICTSALSAKPLVLSLGVGEDASFERAMVNRFGAEVWAFDPTPKSARYVAEFSSVVEASRWADRFHFEEVGVGEEDGNAVLALPANPHHVSGRVGGACINCEHVSIRLESLDHLLLRAAGHVDVLKMDVETMEFPVLDQLLQKPCSQIPFVQLLVEYHDLPKNGNKIEEHRSLFRNCGFHRIKVGPESGTYFFVRRHY